MIHVCIPECSLGRDEYQPNLPPIQKYQIYINGVFHCSLRYSQLLRLHEHLCEQGLAESFWPKFPPKKLFKLNEKQLTERRLQLEKYLQAVCETATNNLCLNSVFTQFFHAAQQASMEADCEVRQLDVFTLDGTKISLSVDATENSRAVLNKLAQAIGLRHSNVSLFGLFLLRKGPRKLYSIVKWLQDFESPLLTLQRANETDKVQHKIVVRKGVIDPFLENSDVFADPAAVKLLYTQAVSDVDLGLVPVPEADMLRLSRLRQKAHMQEYVKVCQAQPFYGHLHFDSCSCISDYPRKNTRVEILIGCNVLVFRFSDSNSQSSSSAPKYLESVFKLTRIRCWKLVRTGENLPCFHLSFEYLMTKDHMEWISINSPQAVLISLCLHIAVKALVKAKSQHQAAVGDLSPNLPAKEIGASPRFQQSPKLPSFKQNGCSNRSHVYESFRDIEQGNREEQKATNEAFALITDEDL